MVAFMGSCGARGRPSGRRSSIRQRTAWRSTWRARERATRAARGRPGPALGEGRPLSRSATQRGPVHGPNPIHRVSFASGAPVITRSVGWSGAVTVSAISSVRVLESPDPPGARCSISLARPSSASNPSPSNVLAGHASPSQKQLAEGGVENAQLGRPDPPRAVGRDLPTETVVLVPAERPDSNDPCQGSTHSLPAPPPSSIGELLGRAPRSSSVLARCEARRGGLACPCRVLVAGTVMVARARKRADRTHAAQFFRQREPVIRR